MSEKESESYLTSRILKLLRESGYTETEEINGLLQNIIGKPKQEGTIHSDGSTLWINDEERCIMRINNMSLLYPDMKSVGCNISGIDVTLRSKGDE